MRLKFHQRRSEIIRNSSYWTEISEAKSSFPAIGEIEDELIVFRKCNYEGELVAKYCHITIGRNLFP